MRAAGPPPHSARPCARPRVSPGRWPRPGLGTHVRHTPDKAKLVTPTTAAAGPPSSNNRDPSPDLAAALDVIARLEAENARLRGMLGQAAEVEALAPPPPPPPAAVVEEEEAVVGVAVDEPVPVPTPRPPPPPPSSAALAGIAWPTAGEAFWERPPRSDGGAAVTSSPPAAVDHTPPHPSRRLSIVHVAAELAPRAKVGGLGDVVAGLALACAARGHDALVCLPFYECLPDVAVVGLTTVDAFDVPRGGGNGTAAASLGVTVHTGTLDGVAVALFRPDWAASPLFRGARIYGGNHSEVEAYLFFCRAVLDWLARAVAAGTRPRPDALHVHDWQCAPAAMLFWHAYARTLNPGAAVVLTIHNFDCVGECRTDEWAAATGVPAGPFAAVDRALDERTIGHNPERLCLLKGGIVYANGGVVTVSPTYAREAAEGGAAGWLRSTLLRPDVRRRFLGVLNGIDTAAWNPATDAFLPLPYTSSTAAQGKAAAKRYVQLGLGLAADPAAPLAVCVSRLVPQKGVHLIRQSIFHVTGAGGQFVLLGTGHADGEFRALADGAFRDSSVAKMCLFYSDALAHLLYAAADVVVVPSMFEPCGLTQLIALRYGAIPVVRATGGLADTVTDVDADPVGGNGFSFTGADEGSLDGALSRALAMHRDRPDEWAALVARNMASDVGWDAAAGEYERLYAGGLVVKD